MLNRTALHACKLTPRRTCRFCSERPSDSVASSTLMLNVGWPLSPEAARTAVEEALRRGAGRETTAVTRPLVLHAAASQRTWAAEQFLCISFLGKWVTDDLGAF